MMSVIRIRELSGPRAVARTSGSVEEFLMPLHEVPQHEWPPFLDSFNRQHDGWLSSVDLVRADHSRPRIPSDVPLHGVVLDQSAGRLRISFLAGPRGAGDDVE